MNLKPSKRSSIMLILILHPLVNFKKAWIDNFLAPIFVFIQSAYSILHLQIPFDLFVCFCLDCARADASKVNIDKTICFFCGFSIDRGNIADVWVAAEKCNLRTLKIAVYHHLVRPPHKLRDPFFIQATS